MSAELTNVEADALAECEAVISKGLGTFVEVGRALLRIRDERLYRTTYERFEDYCQSTWSLSRTRAYELMAATGVVSAIADTGVEPPANEAQARELARVPEPQRAEVWRETVERTNGRPTAAAVRETFAPPTRPPLTREEVDELRVENLTLPVPTQPEPETTPDPAVTAWLESDPALAEARYLAAFAKALARCDEFAQFDPEKVARRADEGLWRSMELLADQAHRFVEAGRRARRHLQVISGGGQ